MVERWAHLTTGQSRGIAASSELWCAKTRRGCAPTQPSASEETIKNLNAVAASASNREDFVIFIEELLRDLEEERQ
jgi:hypothetical protein